MNPRDRMIPLRQRGDQPDGFDGQRLLMLTQRWDAQNTPYLGYAKTTEEHIRMLAGRQWDRWSSLYGRFVDVLQFMSENEQRYRMRPVMDYLGYWFVLTLSKCIENPTTISFQPATSDRMDALLAEVMDPIWKTLFHEMGMDAQVRRMVAWQLVAGEGYFQTRVDFQRGLKRKLIAPAVLRLDRGEGQEPIERVADAVPYDRDGEPLAQLVPDGESGDYGFDVTGEPYEDLEGAPAVDVLCPLQVRAQWGQHIPWRDKRWIITESFLTADQVAEQTGVELPADHYVAEDTEGGPGYLERMLFGTGYFGAVMEQAGGVASGALGAQSTATQARLQEGFCRVLTMWEKPVRGLTDQDDDSPGGRLLIVAPGAQRVLWDSARPFRTAAAGPIRRVAFIDIPGRPQGTTVLERLVPLQRRLNRIEAHIAQHTNLCTDPILMVHEAAGIDEDQFVAKPGLVITHGYNGAGDPAKFLVPPGLSADVWKHKADVREQLFIVGSMMGNQSAAPTANASGELVEQLRVNADRPLTPLTINLATGIGEVAEDLMAILPTIWTEEKLIAYAGQDNVVRTVKIIPEMLDGSVNVKPNVESALAESKGSRRQRVIQLFQMGAFGDILNPAERPKAVQQLLELLNYPDLTRATRPGGVDRVMAEHNVGRLVRGDTAADIPVLDVYDTKVHLDVVENEMKSPEYLLLDDGTQHEFVKYRALLQAAQEAQAYNTIERELPVEQARAAATGAVAAAGASAGPQPPAGNAPGGPTDPAGPDNNAPPSPALPRSEPPSSSPASASTRAA